jgi:hypothetical protein
MRLIARYNMPLYHVISGFHYTIEETPPMYDPITLEKVYGYIVIGDDGNYRKLSSEITNSIFFYFMSLEDHRDEQINKILL